MFLIGSAQNIGAHDLHKAVQCFLDEMKSRRVEACCPGNDEAQYEADLCFLEELSQHESLIKSIFKSAEMYARHNMNRWHQEGLVTISSTHQAHSAGYEPEAEMVFVQAVLQARSSEDLLRRVMRDPPRRMAAVGGYVPNIFSTANIVF